MIPSTTGYTRQMQNVGQVTNKGFELTVGGDLYRSRDAVLSANFTMGINKTHVDHLNGDDKELWATSSRWSSSDNDFCLREGEEVGLIYGYVYDGLYSFDEFDRVNFNYIPKEGTVNGDGIYKTQPGRPKFKDLSGPEGKPDGIIDEYDRTIIGNTNPRLQGGFSLSGQWKNFDFNANFTYMRHGERVEQHGAETFYNWAFGSISTTFTLPAKFYIDLSYNYQSRIDLGNCWVEPDHRLQAGVKKRFGDRFTASFSVQNLLDQGQVIGAHGDGFVRTMNARQTWSNRSFRIGLTYNFKSGKAFKRKAVEAGSADEKSRL